MKLNEQSKNELRKEIEVAVKRVPEGQRIHLDKELLDDLIFLKIKDKEGVIVKFPIWTGEFLRNIDLSEISFENVCLSATLDCLDEYIDLLKLSKFNKNGFDYRLPFINDVNERKFEGYPIDFSYTNINIDFSKIYKPLDMLEGVNFEGTDLSNSNILSLDKWINYCNFSNTNITTFPIYHMNNNLIFNVSATNFSYNDFSKVEYDLLDFISNYENDDKFFPNFVNTGIKFNFDFQSDDGYKEKIFDYIEKGFLDGCYLNGELIQYKERKFVESIMFDIEEQIRNFRGK